MNEKAKGFGVSVLVVPGLDSMLEEPEFGETRHFPFRKSFAEIADVPVVVLPRSDGRLVEVKHSWISSFDLCDSFDRAVGKSIVSGTIKGKRVLNALPPDNVSQTKPQNSFPTGS